MPRKMANAPGNTRGAQKVSHVAKALALYFIASWLLWVHYVL